MKIVLLRSLFLLVLLLPVGKGFAAPPSPPPPSPPPPPGLPVDGGLLLLVVAALTYGIILSYKSIKKTR